MKEALVKKFGSNAVRELEVREGELPLLLVEINARTNVSVLVTDGLRNYKMPVPEKEEGKEHNELYFCLPSYWEIDELENPRMNWVFHWIQRLAKHVQEKETWFGHGHTMPAGKEKQAISETMKQNHFMLSQPLLLQSELQPIEIDGKMIHFLAIIPIYEDECTYKLSRGTKKFVAKFTRKGNSENLDDFRVSTIRHFLKVF